MGIHTVHGPRRRVTTTLGGVLAAVMAITSLVLASAPAVAQATTQFTLFDATGLTQDERTYFQPRHSGPTNWTSPVDFASGTVYLRAEITSKPSDLPVGGLICMWRNEFAEEACSTTGVFFETAGTYYANLGSPQDWWVKDPALSFEGGHQGFDWARALDGDFQFARLMINYEGRLLMNRRCLPSNCWDIETNGPLEPHVPIRADLSVVVVAAGEELAAPAGWSDCPSWVCSGGATEPPTTEPPAPTPDKTAALIVGRTPLSNDDRAYATLLGNSGFDVTNVADEGAATTNLTGFDAVVISGSANSRLLGPWLASTPVPILSAEQYAARSLGLGTGGANVGRQRTIRIVDAASPLAAGATGTPTVMASSASIGAIRRPDPNVDVVATAARKRAVATIVTAEAGVELRTGAAPARRVGFFFGLTGASDGNNTGKAMFAAALEWLVSDPDVQLGPWWNNGWDYRLPIYAASTGVVQDSIVVDAAIDVTSTMQAANAAFDPNSLRVVEVNSEGTVVNTSVPFQFDRAAGFNARNNAAGTITIVPSGGLGTTSGRTFHVYFDTTAKNRTAVTFAERVSVRDITDDGFASWEISTDGNKWVYHRTGGGFASLIDDRGNDWISYSTAPESAGDFRGIPNAVSPRNGGHFHPGRTTASSTIVSEGPLKVTIESTAGNGQYRSRWHIYPTFARMTMERNQADYWFLYEGTPGGSVNGNDRIRRAGDNTNRPLSTEFSADLPADEWAAFLDLGVGKTLVVAQAGANTEIDSHRVMNDEMTVFGFGRERVDPQLDGPNTFTVQLLDTTNGNTVSNAGVAAARFVPPTVSGVQQRS